MKEALKWIAGNDTGISSRTIWSVMMGVVEDDRKDSWDYDPPSDSDDFGRCYRLLVLVPEWRERLPEVGEIFPKWRPLIRNWDNLTGMYERGEHREISHLIKSLYPECMELAGFERTGPGSYKRKNDGSKDISLGNGVRINL